MDVGATSGQVLVDYAVYAVPAAVMDADHDTGFRPGTNDWDIRPLPTELTPDGQLLGIAVTETWYYNTRASTTPLYGRFTTLPTKDFTNRTGYRWTAVTDNAVSVAVVGYASAAYEGYLGMSGGVPPTPTQQANIDQLQFNQIRASFALSALNGTQPVPVLVAMQLPDGVAYYVVAYRTTGNQVFIADVTTPGNGNASLTFTKGTPVVYALPAKSGSTVGRPLVISLGIAVPLGTVASSYQQVVAGTIGNDLFPAATFKSASGLVFDTAYVVDTLRVWAECAGCKYGFSTTISPPPAAHLAGGFKSYYVANGAATDSAGGLNTNGSLFYASPKGDQTLGFILNSATAEQIPNAGSTFQWLNYHQLTFRTLQTSIVAPTAPPSVNTAYNLSMKVDATLLPKSVTYRWDFGDGTPKVTVANSPNAPHTYTKDGTYTITCEIVDDRNTQVIARSTASVTVITAITFTVSGTSPAIYMPPNGTYSFGDLQAYYTASPSTQTSNLVFDYDNTIGSQKGVDIVLSFATTTQLAAGMTFVPGDAFSGNNVVAMSVATNLDPNQLGNRQLVSFTGSLTLTSVLPQPDGSLQIRYTFSFNNGLGGVITGSGIGKR
jgi:hypothetical protein